MSRIQNRLVQSDVDKLPAGRHHDGGGLYLRVTPTGARMWEFRFTLAGQQSWMGLGATSDVSLHQARRKATGWKLLVVDGLDPIAIRNQRREFAAQAARTA